MAQTTAIQKLLLGQAPLTPEETKALAVLNTEQLLQLIAANTALIKSPVPNRPSFFTGQKLVPTSGTPQQLPTVAVPDGFTAVVKAKKANTGNITIGPTVGSASHTGTDFFTLGPNESVKLQIQNFDLIWIDAVVSGEGVELLVEQ